MPELPDIQLYLEALAELLAGETITGHELRSPFLVRTPEPSLDAVLPCRVHGFSRIGKRIVWQLDGNHYLVFHLMIAGRYHWRKPGTRPRKRTDLLALHFGERGTLMVTEAGSKRRASLHIVCGEEGLTAHDPGGLEVLESDPGEFGAALKRENHTLKRALTDPRILSGIGNAYSDEILHRAGLSPFRQTQRLDDEELQRLWTATRATLTEWIERLEESRGGRFPEKVTAFREGMAVHGRFGQPCPACQTAVQKIEYAANEMNYCPRCQTGGKLLADRGLSRLLREDWPKTIEALEERFQQK